MLDGSVEPTGSSVLIFPMIIRLTGENIREVLERASSILEAGGIVAYPTETFYGLGARFDREQALERVYAMKQRPREKAMPLIIGRREELSLLTDEITAGARGLMERFWPGPLTILFRAGRDLPGLIVSEGKVAVRMPGESFALLLARELGIPITSTSANPSGLPPAETAQMVSAYFGEEPDLIIDAGRTAGGLPSTIVDATGDSLVILRKGAVGL